MNEQHTDVAFKPMDEAKPVAGRGPRPDGTVEYAIVEGDTYVDGKLQPKEGAEVVGHIQLEKDQ